MKRFILTVFTIILSTSSAYSADDTVTRAVKLFEKRHYEEAANLLRSEAASIDPAKQSSANLTLGMVYFKNALLHRELYRASLSTYQDYLKKLSAARGKDRSRFADLYYGDTLIEAGKPGAATALLEKFAENADIETRYRNIAKVLLGLSYHLNNDASKAASLWAGVDSTDPDVKAELAAAYSRVGLREKNPVVMTDECITGAKKSGKALSMRLVKNALSVYAEAGLIEKGLDLLKRADLKAFSFRETVSKSKIITFYDVSLLGDMATLYGQASVAYLEKAAADQKVKDASDFTLTQAYALFGSMEKSSRTMDSFVSTSKMPQQYKDRVRVWQGANLYLKNRQSDAAALWDQLSQKQPVDNDVLAEILSTCSRLKIDCPKMMQQGASSVEAGEGRKFTTLSIAMGTYYLGKHDNARAVAYLEGGRDKSNKNKIESNDPAMLVSLAEVYFQTKKFSEALEIYFEMSKQFPQVRQIQEALQGVYAMEHKSAGDVKIN